MARRKKTTDEEQLDLIDVGPENAKAMKRTVRAYKASQAERISWLADEKKHKAKILDLVREEGLQPNEEGIIRFRLNDITITITPRDELVQVKMKSEADEAEDDE